MADNLSLAPATNLSSLVPFIESFPALPDPLVLRDWKQNARDYAQTAFDPSLAGPFLPLIYELYRGNCGRLFGTGIRLAQLRGQSARQRQSFAVRWEPFWAAPWPASIWPRSPDTITCSNVRRSIASSMAVGWC